MDKKKILLLFTHSYPYGKGEQFLDLELEVLSIYFDKIILVPSHADAMQRELPAMNIEVATIQRTESIDKPGYFLILKILCFELVASKQRFLYLKRLRYYIAFIKNAIIKSEIINKRFVVPNPEALCYTYWFGENTFELSILKMQKKITKLISRGHGGDIYEYQHPEKNYIFPFRNFQMKRLDKICAVSRDGAEYLKKNFVRDATKVEVSYLAVEETTSAPSSKSESFTLLSCSTFYPYKRIPFLIEALSFCKTKINWIHVGDEGSEKDRAQQLLKNLPSNINCQWVGFLNRKQLRSFYASQSINLFINVSSSEGLPVTLMEAISYGIPILASNVGGVAEIATKETGILMDKKLSALEVAVLLDGIVSRKISLPKQESILRFWKTNFSSTNYEQFYKAILCAA